MRFANALEGKNEDQINIQHFKNKIFSLNAKYFVCRPILLTRQIKLKPSVHQNNNAKLEMILIYFGNLK